MGNATNVKSTDSNIYDCGSLEKEDKPNYQQLILANLCKSDERILIVFRPLGF